MGRHMMTHAIGINLLHESFMKKTGRADFKHILRPKLKCNAESSQRYLRMRQQNCVLPYLTLTPSSSRAQNPSIFADLRQGDVVYLRSGTTDHLAVITSLIKDSEQVCCILLVQVYLAVLTFLCY